MAKLKMAKRRRGEENNGGSIKAMAINGERKIAGAKSAMADKA